MGYRSQVRFTVRGKHDDVVAALVTFRLENSLASKAIGLCNFIKDGDDMVIKFQADDWKWYSGYEDVDTLNSLFKHFRDSAEDDDKFEGAFVRIGEETNDIEEDFFGNDPYELERAYTHLDSAYDYDETKLGFPA